MQFINLLKSNVRYKKIVNPKHTMLGSIIYIHGFGGSLERVDYLAEHMPEYTWYALDLPFHGETEYSSPKEINVFYYAELVNKFIEELAIKDAIVLGHSMGGAVAAVAYGQKPANYKKLILAGPLNKTSQNLKSLFVTGFYPKTLEQRLDFMDKVYYDSSEIKKDVITIKAALDYVNLLKNNKDFEKNIKDLGLHIISDEVLAAVEQGLNKMEVPVLMAYGEGDNIVDLKNIEKYFQSNVKNLTIQKISKAGHTPWDENPNEFFYLASEFLRKK